MEGRRLAARVVAHGVDLVGGDVELVAALVLEEQVVTLGPSDGALDHASVPGDAVLMVDDEVARLQILEEALRVGAPGAGSAVGTPPTGDVALGEDGKLGVGEHETSLEGLHDDLPARSSQVDVAVLDDGQGQAFVAQG